jgi:hypothetical protein
MRASAGAAVSIAALDLDASKELDDAGGHDAARTTPSALA